MIARGVFIVGTDTGIGKTVVTAALNIVLRQGGVDTIPMKPIQTGCDRRSGRKWVSADLEFCLALAQITPSKEERQWMAPYCFKMPASPHLAAEQAGQSIDLAAICAAYRFLARRHDLVILEGAGGLLVPIMRKKTTEDLIRLLNVPVIVVARPGLGTINHTLLTLRELGRAKIPVAGVIFNAATKHKKGLIEEDNEKIVAELSGCPVIASLPFMPELKGARMDVAKVRRRVLPLLPPADQLLAFLKKARPPRF